ncbi:MAG: TIGR03668 family PPOX class F420-dependent oxidoreductase [Actinomycetota bacterium]
MDEAEARSRFAASRVARLATVRPDGSPHLVPVVFALDGATIAFAVDHKPKSTRELQRLANLRADPRVSVLVDHYEEDWPEVWWVRLRGQGRVIESGAERERAIRVLSEKYDQYDVEAPQGAVIALDVEEWRGWAYTE